MANEPLKPRRTCETCAHAGHIHGSDLMACLKDYPNEQRALIVTCDDGCPDHILDEYFKAILAA